MCMAAFSIQSRAHCTARARTSCTGAAGLISASQRGICVLLSPAPTTTITLSQSTRFYMCFFIISIITAALRMGIYKFTHSLHLLYFLDLICTRSRSFAREMLFILRVNGFVF